jgi:hypothetical protein
VSDESEDMIDIDAADKTTLPLYKSAPERIGLAIGDESEDWLYEFDDTQEVTWFSGVDPVSVCIPYVRADRLDEIAKRAADQLIAMADEKQALRAQVATLTAMADKVNAIRNSIVGAQTVNFSEHVYPLVAALNEAGFKGLDYAEARENVGSLIEQVATLTAELARGKALVEGAPVEWRRYKECRTGLIYNDRHSISGEYELIELISRPNLNLEQKP